MRISSILVLLGCLILAACDNTAQASLKVGVVDIARLMRDSVPGRDGAKVLESLEEELKATLEQIGAKVEQEPENEALMRDLQTAYGIAQQRLQIQGQNVAGALYDTLQKVMDQYRTDNAFDLILDQTTVVSFSSALDVTNAVMAELNKQKVDFLSAPQEIVLPDLNPSPNQPVSPDSESPAASKPEPELPSGDAPAADPQPGDSPAAAPDAEGSEAATPAAGK